MFNRSPLQKTYIKVGVDVSHEACFESVMISNDYAAIRERMNEASGVVSNSPFPKGGPARPTTRAEF